MDPNQPATFFAPAGRSSPEELQREVQFCLKHPVIELVLEMVDSYVLVSNEHRQMLAANQELLDALSVEDPACFQGLRPGEILECTHVPEGPDGCGTSKACSRCGAVLAILASQSLNEPVSRECLMERRTSGRWEICEFRVRATPLTLDSMGLTVTVLQDISAEKRTRQMEGLFLHDLRNTVQGLCGWSELLLDPSYDSKSAGEQIHWLAEVLSGDMIQQQMMLRAERGELRPLSESISIRRFFEVLESTFSHHPSAQEHLIDFLPPGEMEQVEADPSVLRRVLTNMITNALEATPPGDSVRVWHEEGENRSCFFVHNPGNIPEAIRPHIFQRAFSTKGRAGRGLGAYSMKYLGENILGGEVGFSSSLEEGTCFHLFLPRQKKDRQDS